MFKTYFLAVCFALIFTNNLLKSQETITLTDKSINAGETLTLTKDNEYLLDGFVYVEEGAVLNIEAGTVIKAKLGEAENASALVIARGGKLLANGTKDAPIIFTSEIDDVNDPLDLPIGKSGLWGGVIVLGKATINTPGGVEQIEGIPSNEPRGTYGGNDDDDNSGVLRYVSIRHGGTNIGANNEINGLTFGGVGRGTLVEFIEVYANADDGIEFFGGTVNTKNIAVVFCEDDSFDWDEGYRGNNQFWFSIQSETTGNNMGENDGATDPEDSKPYAIPIVYNSTFIGSGKNSERSQSRGLHLRDNSGGYYKNSIFLEFGGAGIEIEDLKDSLAEDSKKRLETGDIQITNNIWYNIGDNSFNGISPDVSGSNAYSQNFVREYLSQNNNHIIDPLITKISRTNNNGLDPRPNQGPAWELERASLPSEVDFFQDVNYYGAFGQENWLESWTFLDKAGFLTENTSTSVDETSSKNLNNAYIYPNPVENIINIEFSLSLSSKVSIDLFDSFGNKVLNFDSMYLNHGNHSKSYKIDNIKTGIYFLKIVSSTENLTHKVIVK